MAEESMKRPNVKTSRHQAAHDPANTDADDQHAAPQRPFLAFRFCDVLTLCCILLIRGYQATIGPLMGGHCRFHPTCSAYAIECYRAHGVLRGTWLTIKRLFKCHPFSRSCGFDPVPEGSKGKSA